MGDEDSDGAVLAALHTGVVPATGCTEPVSVALAAAVATRALGEPVERLRVLVSANVMKNAMAVVVPGTGRPGPAVAAAAGALAGDPEAGLLVLAGLDEAAAVRVATMVDEARVEVAVDPAADGLVVEVQALGASHRGLARIEGSHTAVVCVERDGTVLQEVGARSSDAMPDVLAGLRLAEVLDWCRRAPLDELAFLEQAEALTVALAEEGLRTDYGLRVGRVLTTTQATGPVEHGSIRRGELPQWLVDVMVARAAAASDARMGGAALPAMTNAGSGNQGITATTAPVLVADALGVGREERLRALAAAHLVALHVHSRLPVLSGFCATLSAAMGAAAGMLWLLDGSDEAIARAINTMAGDATGMVCDGAGCSCTLKVSTSTATAARAVQLSLAGIGVPGTNGLVHDDVDDTLRALGEFAHRTREVVDGTVLQVMLAKPTH